MDTKQSDLQNDNFKLIYSPRTTYNSLKSYENELYIQLLESFDIKMLTSIQRHFKEHLGSITKDLFICILKQNSYNINPKLINRKKIMIKLLSKLFDEIDLDSKEIISWSEFCNFILNFNEGNKVKKYYLKKYYQSKSEINPIEKIDENSNKDIIYNNNKKKVNYCFYIEKFRFLGIVKEGDSKINFFNTETNKRLNLEIDLLSIQNEIDKYFLYQLDEKIENLLVKKEEDYLNHKKNLEEKRIKLMNKRNKRINSNSEDKSSNSYNKRKIKKENEEQKINLNKSVKVNKLLEKNERKQSGYIINSNKTINNTEGGINKKFYQIATTLFLNEYNLLIISTTNNIISSWKYKEKEEYFENVNLINYNIENKFNQKKCVFEKDEILIPLLMTEHTQYSICFDDINNCLYTGQTDGKIFKWDITLNNPSLILDINKFSEKNNLSLPKLETSNDKYQKETKEALLKKGQNDLNKILKSFPEKRRNMVSCLIFIEPLKILCSAHYNGVIVLWDMIYYRPKRIYNDQKYGVYQILYNYNMNHIYSCGFEHDIFVYDPYTDKEAIFKLKGHKSSINSIALIPENNELISIDISGIIKIWDISNFFNFQTININDNSVLKSYNIEEKEEIINKIYKKRISANFHIKTFPDLSKFLVYGKKFLLFEKGNSINPELCDDYKIIGCFYNPKTNNIITISLKKVQFWNILNGKLIKMFRDLMSQEKQNLNDNSHLFENEDNSKMNYDITSFTHDIHYKKLFLGDSKGRIKSFSLETGDFINQFEKHKNEITDLIYSFKYDYLISSSTDLDVKIHKVNQKMKENKKSIRELELIYEKDKIKFESRITKIILRKMILDEEKGILITCLSNGFIKEFDIEHFKFINEMNCLNISFDNLKNLTLITTVEYIKDINMLFISLDNNRKKLVALKSNRYFNILKGKDIYFNENIINENKNSINHKSMKNLIICCYYDIKSHKLFLGDSFGDLLCYDLTILYNNFFDKNILENNSFEKIVKNGLNFDILFKIHLNNEPINYIFKPQKLIPEILIVLSLDKTAKLIDFNSGMIIDSLKQMSVNEIPFPIAVKYSINTPFEKKNEKSELQIKTIEQDDSNKYSLTIPQENQFENRIKKKFPYILYRKNINFDKKPIKLKLNEGKKKRDLIQQSHLILINSVKKKLELPKFAKDIPENKSTLWKYEINLDNLRENEEENITKINEKLGKKEEEINITEKEFNKYNLHDKNYIPQYINDLSQDKINKIKLIINKKIKDVNLSYNKKVEIKKEENKLVKTKKSLDLSIKNNNKNYFPIKNDINIFLTPIKPLKKSIIKTKSPKKKEKELEIINENKNIENKIIFERNNSNFIRNNRMKLAFSSRKYKNNFKNEIIDLAHLSKEDKFKEFKIQFDEEIKRPLEYFKLRKKYFNI